MIEVAEGIDFKEMIKASSRWRHNIVGFVKEALKVPEISWQQENALVQWQELIDVKLKMHLFPKRSLTAAEDKLKACVGQSIRSGKGPGKDALASWIGGHELICFPDCKIFCTSINADHMKQVLWPEMIKWFNKSIIRNLLQIDAEKIYMIQNDKRRNGKSWFMVPKVIRAKLSDKNITSGFSGLHEDYMFFIIDEWAGLPDVIMEQIISTLTKPVNLCFGGFNPTRAQGYAADTHKKVKIRKYWMLQHWNSRESPHVSPESIKRMEDKFGKNSNEVRIFVDGDFPVSSENNVYPWEWLELSMGREIEPTKYDERVAGLDPGKTGDDTCLTFRHGPVIVEQFIKSEPDEWKLFLWVKELLAEYKFEKIYFDTIGLGVGVGAFLNKELPDIAVPADVKVTPMEPRYINRRAELAAHIRTLLRQGTIAINPELELLRKEMAIVEYHDRSELNTKEQIVSTDWLKVRLGYSPNRYASLLLTYFGGDNTHRNEEEFNMFYNPSDKLYNDFQQGQFGRNKAFLRG